MFTVHSTCCSLYILHVQCTLYMFSVHSTCSLYTLHVVHCTRCSLYTLHVHCTLYMFTHCTLYMLYSTCSLHTLHVVHSTRSLYTLHVHCTLYMFTVHSTCGSCPYLAPAVDTAASSTPDTRNAARRGTWWAETSWAAPSLCWLGGWRR